MRQTDMSSRHAYLRTREVNCWTWMLGQIHTLSSGALTASTPLRRTSKRLTPRLTRRNTQVACPRAGLMAFVRGMLANFHLNGFYQKSNPNVAFATWVPSNGRGSTILRNVHIAPKTMEHLPAVRLIHVAAQIWKRKAFQNEGGLGLCAPLGGLFCAEHPWFECLRANYRSEVCGRRVAEVLLPPVHPEIDCKGADGILKHFGSTSPHCPSQLRAKWFN